VKSKKKQSEDGPSQDGIRVMVVSLFIILLAFFIVLNSMAVIDDKRSLAALGSLIGSFGILPGGISPSKAGDVRVLTPGHIPMASRAAESVEVDLSGKEGNDAVTFEALPEGQIISIQEHVLFEKDGFKIKPAGYGFLKMISEIINEGNYPIEITGHTDNRPAEEKSATSNWALSSLRAIEVLKFFAVIGDVLPSRLTAYGCGEYKPVSSNETRHSRERNRRIEIFLEEKMLEGLKDIYQRDMSGLVVFKRFVFSIFD